MGLLRTPQSEGRHKKQGCSFHKEISPKSRNEPLLFCIISVKQLDSKLQHPFPPTGKILNLQCARSQVPIFKLEVKIIHCAHLENKFKGEVFSAAIFDF